MVRERSGTMLSRMSDKVAVVMPTDMKRSSTMGLTGRPLRWLISFAATVGFSLFGYDQGLMSGIVSGKQFCQKEFKILCKNLLDNDDTTHDDDVRQGAVTACYEIGCFFGALFVLGVGERCGRKPLIMTGCFIIIIGTAISATAFGDKWGLGQFVIGRVITGIGNGMNTATIPVWQSEIARPELRGRLVQLEGSVVGVGTMIAYWLDYGLSFVDSSIQWRLPVAMQIVFALIVFLLMIGLPESPRWLVNHEREEEARPIYAALEDVPLTDEIVETRLAHAINDSKRSGGGKMRFSELMTHGKTAHFSRMLIGASTQFFQQFTGCNAAIYYSTILFKKMDLGDVMSLTMGGIFASIYAGMTLPAFYLIEKWGRRPLFLFGAIGQGCSFIITMGCLAAVRTSQLKRAHADLTPHEKQVTKGAAVGLYLFISFFAMSILGLPWIYPPEINPLRTRTAATAVSTCTNWLSNFAVVMFTPVFVGNAGWGAYLFFALINFIWVPVIFLYYPETAGRSLEEIDIIFARAHEENKMPWRVAAVMPKMDNDEVHAEARRLGLHLDDELLDEESGFDSNDKAAGYESDTPGETPLARSPSATSA